MWGNRADPCSDTRSDRDNSGSGDSDSDNGTYCGCTHERCNRRSNDRNLGNNRPHKHRSCVNSVHSYECGPRNGSRDRFRDGFRDRW